MKTKSAAFIAIIVLLIIIVVLIVLSLVWCKNGFSVASPRKVIYIDWRGIDWNNPQQSVKDAVDAGFNVINIAFWMEGSIADMAQAWQTVSQADQQSTIQYAHSKGAVVLVTAGGSTESPYSQYSGEKYGSDAATWAKANNLDGVDFDMENILPGFTYGSLTAPQLVQWLVDASRAVKTVMSSTALVTHAPQGPYFGPIGAAGTSASLWPGVTGGYSGVYAALGDGIDWFNVQFYNQGATCYVDYAGIFANSGGNGCVFPGTSVSEIASYGLPLSKIVVGKFISGGGGSGYVDPQSLSAYFKQASSSIGWSGGLMLWLWDGPGGAAAKYLETVYDP